MAVSQFVQEAGVSLHFTVCEVGITGFWFTLFVNSHPFYILVYEGYNTIHDKISWLSMQRYQPGWESLWKIEIFPGLITDSVSGRPSVPQGQGRRLTPGATPKGNKRPSGNKLVGSSSSSCRTGGRLHKPQCNGMQQKLRRLHRGFRTFETWICRLWWNKINGQTAQSNSDKSREEDKITHDLVDVVTGKISERLLHLFPQQAYITKAVSYKWNNKHATVNLEHLLFTCLCDVMDFHKIDRSLLVVCIKSGS